MALNKLSERATRGCAVCGWSKGGEPEYSYWYQDSETGRKVMVGADTGTEHKHTSAELSAAGIRPRGRFRPGGSTAPVTVSAETAPIESAPEPEAAEPEAKPDPTELIQAAMAQAADAVMVQLGLKPASLPEAVSGPSVAAPGITAKTGIWQLLAATAVSLPRVILYGPPGTGKTYLAMAAGVNDPADVDRVNMTEDTPAAELRGHYVPTGGGEFKWHDGPAMRRFRSGGRLVVDEITRATDDALSFLLAVLDGHPVTLPSGEVVERHPEFTCWATTNDGPEALTDALADRFTVRIECNEVNPEALATLPDTLSRIVTAGDDGGVSFREAAEYHRLVSDPAFKAVSASAKRDLAAEFVWGRRAKDVSAAIEMGTKLN